MVPLLKAGKDPASVGSFLPVCLTSCLSKWFERVIARRMSWWLEANGRLSVCQAGFREGMGVNDQLVRLSQCLGCISDERENRFGAVRGSFQKFVHVIYFRHSRHQSYNQNQNDYVE